MNKILLLCLFSIYSIASWEMIADNKGGAFIYNTKDARVLYCKTDNTIKE